VLVEVDVGGERCGVPSGEPTLELATQITQSLNLKFLGLQAYKGTAQNQREFGDRENASSVISGYLKETIELLKEHGITCKNVTGAGTGTWQFEGASNIFTELQPGSYAFMDADYARNKNSDGKTASEFGHSLFVYTTVMSAVHSDYVVVDAGLKSLAFDAGMPLVADDWTVNYHTPSDEHGVLDLSNSTRRYALGEKVRLIPGHCDPTVNLHDWYIGVRGDLVESVWTVTARGAVF
jgi:D-serine deaminase-like pyridoxal phosphate-dependent protein